TREGKETHVAIQLLLLVLLPGVLDPIPIRIPIPYHPCPPHRRTSKLKTPDSAQVGPIAATRANAVVGQATPSASTAAPASPAGTSRPVRSWVGVARAWGRLAGTKGGGLVPVCWRVRRALVLIRVGVVSMWIWIWVGGIRALGPLWGRAGAGGGTAAKDVDGAALGAAVDPSTEETRRRRR
ncbi:hypothetical protein B0H13DRAFT_2036481, partial [Mycena leptocephala]